MNDAPDPGLSIPIAGVQLIEASAGSGKTFVLATLYSRLVIETGLAVPSILAVTFTEVATGELRERLRARLLLAVAQLDFALASVEGIASLARADDTLDHEAALTRRLVHAAAIREGAARLRHRLRLAAEQMDLAPILTIHGFCRRALADHALEAGQPLRAGELLQNEARLREEVALEFWRANSRDIGSATTLAELWSSPAKLAESLRELLEFDVLLPAPAAPDEAPLPALVAARAQLAQAFAEHGASARELLREACAQGTVHAGICKDTAVDATWRALQSWQAAPLERDPDASKLADYSGDNLRLRTNKKAKSPTPVSPLFDAVGEWKLAWDAYQPVLVQRRVTMVHAARDYARVRMRSLKRERGLIGFDDMIRGVAEALDGADGESFAQRLRTQYAVALVDEFQDTDARQWDIFRRVFTGPHSGDEAPRALFLIGDPKQAIYRFRGGDVFTYLAAAAKADARHLLTRNFRSRPLALHAVQALFELSGADAFAQPGIVFETVQPGGSCVDADLQSAASGESAVALTVLTLPQLKDKDSIDCARRLATDACVTAIGKLLHGGEAQPLRIMKSGAARAVCPADIAVLVEKNSDAERMQCALSLAGIASVAAGRSSLYDSAEAQHLCWLFAALLVPGDEGRMRAALAAPLFGLDAEGLTALDTDESAHRAWQEQFQQWQQRVLRFGPGALLSEICAGQSARLLGLLDGERRLSNYLQLGEELQAGSAHALGLAGLLADLEQRIADADSRNDAELLRLESDARRVRILTLHMSKGLEFELVFLPYLATGGYERRRSRPELASYHDGERRVALLFPEKGGSACLREADEDLAEKLRLLYVGLTRARLATWLVWAPASSAQKTALAWLLHRDEAALRPQKIDADAVAARLGLLQSRAPLAIAVQAAVDTPVAGVCRPEITSVQDVPAAAVARRSLPRDWWVYSFSQLTHEDAGAEPAAADDEGEPSPLLAYSRFSGTRFGNAMHAALENVSMPRWLDWSTPLPPTGELDVVIEALREHGYASDADLEEGVPLLTALISETLNVQLPDGARLAALPDAMRRNEMEFHLALAPSAMPALMALLHRFGIVSDRQGFGNRQHLAGLLTGRIDLIYVFNDRYYVVDYKSNQLPAYDAAAMSLAVRGSEYDLQYVLYSLALHRWLRFRLGAQYDIDRHLGGVRYLYARGLDRFDGNAPGVHALTLPTPLILALDALFQGAGA